MKLIIIVLLNFLIASKKRTNNEELESSPKRKKLCKSHKGMSNFLYGFYFDLFKNNLNLDQYSSCNNDNNLLNNSEIFYAEVCEDKNILCNSTFDLNLIGSNEEVSLNPNLDRFKNFRLFTPEEQESIFSLSNISKKEEEKEHLDDNN